MAPQSYPHPREDTSRALHDDRELVGTVGQEGELSQGNLCEWLSNRELSPPDARLHNYQCTCDERDKYLVHPTSDCTAGGGEYVIGGAQGVLFGSATYIAATGALAEAAVEERACISESVGLHTHVGYQKMDGTNMSDHEKRRLMRNFYALQEQIRVLSAGAFPAVRNQGGKYTHENFPGVRAGASWWKAPIEDMRFTLTGRGYPLNFHTSKPTIEWRIHNATRSQWRMVMVAGVSVAMTEAACQGREVGGPDNMDLLDHIGDLLPVDVIELVERQRTFWATYGRTNA